MTLGNLGKMLVTLSGLCIMIGIVEAQDYQCGAFYGKNCTGAYAGQCCSFAFYCGTSSEYCGEGCQSGYGPCLADIADYNCGPAYMGKNCTGDYTGQCCSQAGYCGATGDYCGVGCQSGYGSCMSDFQDYNCGPSYLGKKCTGDYAGQCCSSASYCGITSDYCGDGCQSDYGPCLSAIADYNCGPAYLGKKCTGDYAGQCCSSNGYCGKSSAYCGDGCQSGYGSCMSDFPDYNCGKGYFGKKCSGKYTGQCCSRNGYCGTTTDYCGSGCQCGYGKCSLQRFLTPISC